MPEDAPQKLFTQACLHGLRGKLCDHVDALDSYLRPQMAATARNILPLMQHVATADLSRRDQ
ncbi:hypothetical protein ACFZAV_39275 [Streptomyces sp. NPDC008343]|uniref:hypothetical protein n=1 Tax=Streptomyces sp. NPDC008343 TaxID=3364828 RepID=UPI0036E28DAE